MKRKIVIALVVITMFSILLIASRNMTPAQVPLQWGDSILVGCETGFNIDVERPMYGYQVIKITCPYPGYPGPDQGDYCGYEPPLP